MQQKLIEITKSYWVGSSSIFFFCKINIL